MLSKSQTSSVVESGSAVMLDAIRSAATRIESEISHGPIYPQVSPEEIRTHLVSCYDFSKPIALEDIAGDVEQMLRAWDVQVTHPRYFGLFNPSVQVASVIADTLTAIYNPQLASWRTSPAANEIERHTLTWLADKLGLPSASTANFTTGGAEANLSAVTVALTKHFPGAGEDGLRSLTGTPTIYLSEEAHHSFYKIAHITGLGRKALRTIATDQNLRMDPEDLALKVAEDRRNGFAPFLVVATAGTTAAGAIDPLPELAHFCQNEKLWFHVDAAWGGAAILSPTLRGHLAGIERADSITCDAHKWFSVPMGAGMFFCRHPESVSQAFHAETAYMPKPSGGQTVDPFTTSVQWSRRFIGLKLFFALAHQGEEGYAQKIDHQARMGGILRDRLMQSGWQILNNTPLPVVCFTREGLNTAKFLEALQQGQVTWMSETHLRGRAAIRACVTSFRTTEEDVASVVEQMNELIQ